MGFLALLWANACLPTTDLSSYAEEGPSPLPSNSGGNGGSGGTPPEIVPGPLQNGPDAAAPGNGGSSSTPDAAVITDAGASGRSCTGNGEFSSANGASCYGLFPAVQAWATAQATCVDWGGTLVIIQSNAEDQFLQQNISGDTWIGASDQANEDSFVWVNGTPVQFTNWAASQPDNFGGSEDCVEKRFTANGAWNDVPCTSMTAKGVLCEK
jgi:hypothetical protein